MLSSPAASACLQYLPHSQKSLIASVVALFIYSWFIFHLPRKKGLRQLVMLKYMESGKAKNENRNTNPSKWTREETQAAPPGLANESEKWTKRSCRSQRRTRMLAWMSLLMETEETSFTWSHRLLLGTFWHVQQQIRNWLYFSYR